MALYSNADSVVIAWELLKYGILPAAPEPVTAVFITYSVVATLVESSPVV